MISLSELRLRNDLIDFQFNNDFLREYNVYHSGYKILKLNEISLKIILERKNKSNCILKDDFKLYILFPTEYPYKPPKLFLTNYMKLSFIPSFLIENTHECDLSLIGIGSWASNIKLTDILSIFEDNYITELSFSRFKFQSNSSNLMEIDDSCSDEMNCLSYNSKIINKRKIVSAENELICSKKLIKIES